MRHLKNKSGFTLLEIIIVIIIIGVLASLALPRFFKTIEYSRSAEALQSISTIRQSLERCILQSPGTLSNCNTIAKLDVEDPGTASSAHFSYTITAPTATNTYAITATRTSAVDPNTNATNDTITLTNTAGVITRAGTEEYSGVH